MSLSHEVQLFQNVRAERFLEGLPHDGSDGEPRERGERKDGGELGGEEKNLAESEKMWLRHFQVPERGQILTAKTVLR